MLVGSLVSGLTYYIGTKITSNFGAWAAAVQWLNPLAGVVDFPFLKKEWKGKTGGRRISIEKSDLYTLEAPETETAKTPVLQTQQREQG